MLQKEGLGKKVSQTGILLLIKKKERQLTSLNGKKARTITICKAKKKKRERDDELDYKKQT